MWVGWFRRSASATKWELACEGESLEECSRKLNAATKSLRIKDVNMIMTGGGYPMIGAPRKEKAPR